MNNYVQIQEDVTGALMAAESLQSLPVAQFRKLRLQSVVDYSTLYAQPRAAGGPAGCGVLVEVPAFRVEKPNSAGPLRYLVVSAVVMEEPNLNFTDGGTKISAEEAAEAVLDTLHGLRIDGAGALYADVDAIRSADEFEGLVAYRVSLQMKSPRAQTDRVAIPTITEAARHVTLTCATAGADIWYTTDESFPWPGNSAAAGTGTGVLYEGPFDLDPSVTVLRWAAYKTGMLGSNVGRIEQA